MKLFAFPFAAMGSPCEINLYAASEAQARTVADAAIAEAHRLEARYSRYRDDSLLADINRVAASGGAIEVDAETASLFDYADTCYRESGGLFDVTSGILRRAWRFKEGRLPPREEVDALLGRIGWNKLSWRPPRLKFEPGMEIDFGGIVKEYAADRLATLCLDAGMRHGLVNLGGDIRVVGPHADGRPWSIGIQDPLRQNAAMGALAISHGGVATSGDYARCMTIAGRRYGHVLNPVTGWPVQFLASVTVVADFCVVAGSASTIAMLKEADGPRWLDELGLPHCWVDVNGVCGGSLAQGLQGTT
jgi:thiamine biosynthesis lipoprotein